MSRRVWVATVFSAGDRRIVETFVASSKKAVQSMAESKYPAAPEVCISNPEVHSPEEDRGKDLRKVIRRTIRSLDKAVERAFLPTPAKLTMMAVTHNLKEAMKMKAEDDLIRVQDSASNDGVYLGPHEMDYEVAMVLRMIDGVARHVHEEIELTGFYDDVDDDDPRHVACVAGLISSEVNEMIETVREPTMLPAPKIGPEFTHEEEEAADTFIRHLDYCGWRGISLGAAVRAKLKINKSRGHRHGGKRF